MPNNQEYWKERFTALENQLHEIAKGKSDEYVKYLEKTYGNAADSIDKEIRSFYQQFQESNGLDKAKVNRLLSPKNRRKFQMTLERYIENAKKNGLNPDWIRKLKSAGEVYHISRLEALKFQIQQQVEELHAGQVTQANKALDGLYREGYLHTAYELQRGSGIGSAFAQLNQRQIDRALARPWAKDGLNFSERIWGKYRPELTYELETTLTQGIIRGSSADKIIDAMAKNLGVARERTATLVMTESAFIASSAQQNCMNELDVEKYEIVSALDGTTCKICGARDGEIHAMTDFLVGDTAPPFHPNCRCTTCPYFDDEFTEGETRAARDDIGKTAEDETEATKTERDDDSKTYQVPSNMKYEDWKAQHIDTIDETDDMLGKIRRKMKEGKSGEKLIPYEGLPEELRINFQSGLQNANGLARTVLENEMHNIDYFISNGKSHFNRKYKILGIQADAQPSALAHEIFHGIDKAKNVIGRHDFRKALEDDFERLLFLSGDDVVGYLVRRYPGAFTLGHFPDVMKMRPEYRGISDIFSGFTNNKIHFGYMHKNTYWEKSTAQLQKEAWAQYGRILYDNNMEVLNMLENIFPSFNDCARIALKELI